MSTFYCKSVGLTLLERNVYNFMFYFHLRIPKHIEHYTLYQISALNISRSHFNDTASWRGFIQTPIGVITRRGSPKRGLCRGGYKGRAEGHLPPSEAQSIFKYYFAT